VYIALRIDQKNDCGCKNVASGTSCFGRTTDYAKKHGEYEKAAMEL
jgi:hypothetical protein